MPLHLLALTLLSGDARANPADRPPLDETAFAAAVGATRALLDQEDLDRFAAASEAFEQRLGELTFVPDSRLWAEYLINVAVVAHSRGEDWQTPLATALSLEPSLDRGVGPQHEIATWTPPSPPSAGAKVPRGFELYVDGRPAPQLPAPVGMHLVQLRTSEGLRSALLRNAPVPAEWFPAPSKPPAYSLALSAFGGTGRFSQTVDNPGDFVGSQAEGRPGLGALAQLWWGRPLAFHAELSTQGGQTAVGMRAGPVFAGLGAAAQVASYETIEGREHTWLVLPALAAHLWSGELGAAPVRTDVGLLVASLPSTSTSASLRTAATIGRGTTRFRAGLSGSWRQTTLVQEGFDRSLSASLWQVGGSVGLAWGAW